MTAQYFAPVASPQTPRTAFADRHIGPSGDERSRMLAAIGYSGAEALIDRAVPAAIRTDRPLALPPALSEPA
ncbi:hypothetical protein AB0J52_39580, partial [Spirillospora sp. NPDC049652]